MEFNKKIALIDSDTLIFYSVFNKKDATTIKSLQDCKDAIDSLIFNILNYTKSTHYLLTLTVGRNFRYKISSQYKANRAKLEKPKYFDEIKEYLITKYKAIYHTDLESDDIVNIYKNNLPNSFICACDSDILEGLEGTHFNYQKFTWITTSKFNAEYKFWGDMIMGTHNGVKGLKGKGEKYVQNKFSDELTIDGVNAVNTYQLIVFNEYLHHYEQEDVAIDEFNNTYKCIRILDKYEGLEMVEPIEFNKYEEEYKLVD